jgi:hypothetical protein
MNYIKQKNTNENQIYEYKGIKLNANISKYDLAFESYD